LKLGAYRRLEPKEIETLIAEGDES
jgi:hypothetical protein